MEEAPEVEEVAEAAPEAGAVPEEAEAPGSGLQRLLSGVVIIALIMIEEDDIIRIIQVVQALERKVVGVQGLSLRCYL